MKYLLLILLLGCEPNGHTTSEIKPLGVVVGVSFKQGNFGESSKTIFKTDKNGHYVVFGIANEIQVGDEINRKLTRTQYGSGNARIKEFICKGTRCFAVSSRWAKK